MSGQNEDGLAACLSALAKRKSRLFSESALKDGLPLADGKLNVVSFKRAAFRAGFKSEVVRRGPESLSASLFPLILILKDKSAVILERYEEGLWYIINAHTDKEEVYTKEDLDKLYAGFAIFIERPTGW